VVCKLRQIQQQQAHSWQSKRARLPELYSTSNRFARGRHDLTSRRIHVVGTHRQTHTITWCKMVPGRGIAGAGESDGFHPWVLTEPNQKNNTSLWSSCISRNTGLYYICLWLYKPIFYKKEAQLSQREAKRCFMASNISLSHSKSFDRSRTSSYWCSVLSCVVSETKRDIGRKSRFFPCPCIQWLH